MWLRRWVTVSDSVRIRGGVAGALADEMMSSDRWKLDREKLSSDQHMLSRRNAAVASRFPVWRRAMASSIRPRWQHAWPRTKYLCPSSTSHSINSICKVYYISLIII